MKSKKVSTRGRRRGQDSKNIDADMPAAEVIDQTLDGADASGTWQAVKCLRTINRDKESLFKFLKMASVMLDVKSDADIKTKLNIPRAVVVLDALCVAFEKKDGKLLRDMAARIESDMPTAPNDPVFCTLAAYKNAYLRDGLSIPENTVEYWHNKVESANPSCRVDVRTLKRALVKLGFPLLPAGRPRNKRHPEHSGDHYKGCTPQI